MVVILSSPSHFHIFHDFLKCFKNKHEFNSVIPNNGFMELTHVKINWALVEAPHTWFYDWLIWLTCVIDLSCSMISTQLFCIYSLTFASREMNLLITQVRSLPLIFIRVFWFWFSYVHNLFRYPLISLSIVMSVSFY